MLTSEPLPKLKRIDTVVLVGAGALIPGLAIALMVLAVALKWPPAIKSVTVFLLFAAIVGVVIIFPKLWVRHMRRRTAR